MPDAVCRWYHSKWSYCRLYQAAQLPPDPTHLHKDLRRHQWIFVCVLVIWFATVCSCFMYCYRLALQQPASASQATPMLSGSPQFALLGIIVALSAYMRIVRSGAVQSRDDIAGGKVWIYPITGDRAGLTKMKLKLLDSNANKILLASPLLIFLFIIVALRAVFDAFSLVHPFAASRSILEAADMVILLWTAAQFLILGLVHFVARVRDDRIRAVARGFEQELKPVQEGGSIELSEDLPVWDSNRASKNQ